MKNLISFGIFLFCFLMFENIGKAQLLNASGKISLLRVHEIGTKYGPPADQIDADVIFQIESMPNKAFGFQLRDNSNKFSHQGMLDLLQDAMTNNLMVHFDYNNIPGKNNAMVIRVWLTKN